MPSLAPSAGSPRESEAVICVLFALRRESRPFCHRLRFLSRFRSAPCPARLFQSVDRRVLVVESGVGAVATRRALDWIFGTECPQKPVAVISAGFAGASASGICAGSLFVPLEVIGPDGRGWETSFSVCRPLANHGLKYHTGRLLTAKRLIGDAEEKHALAREHRAAAIDMEAAEVANYLGNAGVPFGCVKAISDEARTSLSPVLASMLSQSRVSLRRLARQTLRSPRLLPELYRLGRSTKIAARHLADALMVAACADLDSDMVPT